ncbi:hypothetical protein TSOC_004851 [Tetrabaena socialis]|uniref:Uncharacterized protein n=1 Tax=Tetrabaena socialis TaxID=47790 RepID=A0A2J8A7V9_9CHLO|nr:hypothetical protein TSOC_004851 [Tetrabaena socialis]|eukprot:PNH08598.1 hypothetical protein TSOC_004851 [Tetrabaena socialis]
MAAYISGRPSPAPSASSSPPSPSTSSHSNWERDGAGDGATLSSGRGTHSKTPILAQMASAVSLLSPVMTITRMPGGARARRRAGLSMAGRTSGRGGSCGGAGAGTKRTGRSAAAGDLVSPSYSASGEGTSGCGGREWRRLGEARSPPLLSPPSPCPPGAAAAAAGCAAASSGAFLKATSKT